MILIDTKKTAANSFEKDFSKLLNNSVYDKTIENLRKITKVGLVNNTKICKKYVRKPCLVSRKIFSNNFVAIHELKLVLTLDKLIYVGFSILDLSKLLMY